MGTLEVARTTATEICGDPRASPLARVDNCSSAVICGFDNAPVAAARWRIERISTNLLAISHDGELAIVVIFDPHVKLRAPKAIGRSTTPVVASTRTCSRNCVQSGGTTTTTICFNPIHFQTVGFVILAIITVMVTAKSATNSIRGHGVDVRDHTCVCLRNVEVELDVTSVQIERCFRGGTTIALNAPTSVLELHTTTVRHHQITGIGAISVSKHHRHNA